MPSSERGTVERIRIGDNVYVTDADHEAAMFNARHERQFWAWKYERREAECEELADRLRAHEEAISSTVEELERRAANCKSDTEGAFGDEHDVPEGEAHGYKEAAQLLRDKAEQVGGEAGVVCARCSLPKPTSDRDGAGRCYPER